MKVLVTAFDPFGGESINPALEAVKALPATIAGADLVTLEVPTVFGASLECVTAAIDAHEPDAVLCVGQAGGRAEVTPERVAINVDDARIADNRGNQPIDRPVVAGAPAAYFATLPVKAMVQAIRDAGVASCLSNTAGTFVCNHLMYGVLHHLASTGRSGVRAGFVHVPFVPEQAAANSREGMPPLPALPLDQIVRALAAAVAAVVEHGHDIELVAGETS